MNSRFEVMVDFTTFLFKKGIVEEVTTDAVENSDNPVGLYKRTKFADMHCIEVDHDTYDKNKFGKKPYSRWSGVVEDETLRDFIRKHYNTNDKLLIKNALTGAMTYLKR